MPIDYEAVLSGTVKQRRAKTCCEPGGPACDECAGAAAVGEFLEGLGELGALRGRKGHALKKLGRAHRSGALGALGDIDMSSFVVTQGTIDAEAAAFNDRVTAFQLDYAGAAARLPASFVQQVDGFIERWRKEKDAFYWFQTNRLAALVQYEAEFNKLRDQFLGYGQSTAIAPATVTVDGKTVRSDQIPPGASWSDKVVTAAKWTGVIVGGVALIKISSDLGVFRRLGRLGGAPT